MAHLTREQILARKTGKGEAILPDGSTVGIRALTSKEVLKGQKIEDENEKNAYYVSKGMTDPKLSIEDVDAWAGQGAAGDIVTVSEAIQEISGLLAGAGKRGVRTSRG